MSMCKNDLLECIDNFIKDKQLINSELQQPNTIKKKELETYLEEFAKNEGIDYQKNCESVKTKYIFSIKGQDAEIEFYYRYGNYYTRHNIIVK
jgi:hypothetical protein